MAATMLKLPGFTVDDVAAELATSWPAPVVDVGLVELAGGPRSPLADDGDGVDLIGLVRPDRCVLVADAGLGAINAVLLALAALPAPPVVVMLNRFDVDDRIHVANRAWLERCLSEPVVTTVEEIAAQLVGGSTGWSKAGIDD
jgi:dethiobiotin synthetase